MEGQKFIFCVLFVTSAWSFCPSSGQARTWDGDVWGGHLESMTPPLRVTTRLSSQGRPHAGTITARNFETREQDLLEVPHDRTPDLMGGRRGDKYFSTRVKMEKITGVDRSTNNKSIGEYPQRKEKSRGNGPLIWEKTRPLSKTGTLRVIPLSQTKTGQLEKSGLTSEKMKKVDVKQMSSMSNAQQANFVTLRDNAPGMNAMTRSETESHREIIETSGVRAAKGNNLKDPVNGNNNNFHLISRLFQTLKLPPGYFPLLPRGDNHNILRRSVADGEFNNETETNTTQLHLAPTGNGLPAYKDLGNQSGTTASLNSSDNAATESVAGNKSDAGLTGVSTDGAGVKDAGMQRNHISGSTNYTDGTSASAASVSNRETSTTATTGAKSPDKVNTTVDMMKEGGRGSGSFDPTTGRMTPDTITTANSNGDSVNDNIDNPPVLPAVTSVIVSTKAPITPKLDKVIVTSQSKSGATKLEDSTEMKTTPLLSTEKETHSQSENNGDGPERSSFTSADGSSVKSTGLGTDPWSMQSDIVTNEASSDVIVDTGITTPVPPYKGTKENNSDKKSASPANVGGDGSSAEPRIGAVLTPSDKGTHHETNSRPIPPEQTDMGMTTQSSPKSEPEPVTEPVTEGAKLVGEDTTAEPTPESEPEPESTSESRGGDDLPFSSAEPGPEWEVAKETWSYAWEIHIYTFGGLFGVLALYTLLSVVRLWRIQRLLSKGYFLSLNTLMLLMCGSRSFYLLYDGYNSNDTFHISLAYFLYSVTFPCLTSAFSILLYALLKATHMQLVSPAVQKLQVLIFIIVVHFVISIAADVLIGFYAGTQVMLFVCQMYFILWGLFIFFGYAYIFRKLYNHALKRQKNVVYTSSHSASSSPSKGTNKFTLSTAVKVTFVTAICGLVTVGLEIYAIVAVYKTFTREHPKPWPWWLYHTVLRLVEFLMCLTMSYVASQPFRYRQTERKCSCGVLCAPCSEILCCGHTINRSNSIAGWSDCGSNVNSLHHENGTSFTSGSTKKLFNTEQTDSIPIVDIQPTSDSRPNSLLIIEDGYVRFHTDNDINRVVDSFNDLSKKSNDNIHNMNTFPLRDGFVNTGYAYNPDEPKQGGKTKEEDTELTDKSRKSSMTSADFFRIPSSVSLADSMENELEKAFESFKLDTSVEEDRDDKSLDFIVVSDIENLKETDLISVDSIPEEVAKAETSPSKQNHHKHHNDHSKQVPSPSRRPFTLLRRAKSSDVSKNLNQREEPSDLYLQQKLCRSFSDHTTLPNSKQNDRVKYSYLMDMETKENQVMNSEGNDLDTDPPYSTSTTRRPSEGQGNQAAILTSLLKSSEIGSNDNIDV